MLQNGNPKLLRIVPVAGTGFTVALFAFLQALGGNLCRAEAQSCKSMQHTQTPQQIRREKITISHRALNRSAPNSVHLLRTLTTGGWTAVFARIDGAEQGVFFLLRTTDQLKLVDVWGGSSGEDTAESIASEIDPRIPQLLRACTAISIKQSF